MPKTRNNLNLRYDKTTEYGLEVLVANEGSLKKLRQTPDIVFCVHKWGPEHIELFGVYSDVDEALHKVRSVILTTIDYGKGVTFVKLNEAYEFNSTGDALTGYSSNMSRRVYRAREKDE